MDPKKRKKSGKTYEDSDIPTTFKSINRHTPKHISVGNMYSSTDPNGSYTGTPYNTDEVPVQDADDL